MWKIGPKGLREAGYADVLGAPAIQALSGLNGEWFALVDDSRNTS